MEFSGKLNSKKCLYEALKYDGELIRVCFDILSKFSLHLYRTDLPSSN